VGLCFDLPLGFDAAAAAAARAEAEGVDGLWTVESDHDPYLPLALAAVATRRLVLGTGLFEMERGGQVEDGAAVLDGHHAAGRERAAVADAVDLVQDRDHRVAGAQEVGVQGVHLLAVLDRAPGGDQRLPGDLSAEHALALLVGAQAPEDVDLDGLEVEQLD